MKSFMVVFVAMMAVLAVAQGRHSESAMPGPDIPTRSAATLTCADEPIKSYPFCNPNLPVDERAKDLVGRMSLEQQVTQIGTTAGGIPELGVPAYQWWSEGLHGVAFSPGVSFNNTEDPVATSFPQIISMGATFDTALYHAMTQVISTEGRAMNNLGHAGLTYFAPNINLIRDPRWGRSQETPGEDPYLTGEYVAAYMRGMQNGEDPRYKKVIATCKHFAAYDLEKWDGVDRHHFDAKVSDYDLYNTYLPAFESCVVKGGAGSIMCSYNAVNGVPSCANKFLLQDIARDQWGFEGYVVSDCGAIDDIQHTHNYTNTTSATCQAALEAGCDMDCGLYYQNFTVDAVKDGSVPQSVLTTALERLFTARFELGMFDPRDDQPYTKLGASDINTKTAQNLALSAAREAMTLLQNNNATLPLSKSISKLAVIGPNANATTVMQGNYQGQAPYLISPLQGLTSYVSDTVYAEGCVCIPGAQGPCANTWCNSTAKIPDAVTAAESADATVLVLGLSSDQESEGQDRYQLTLPGEQWQLATAVYKAAAGKPVILVMMNAGAVALPDEALTMFPAILWVGYPGQSGGQAIAETIFGDNNPSGRLPYTVYPADYVNQLSFFDMNMRSTSSTPGRTYRYYTGTPQFEFGTGLSYSQFTYAWASEEGESALPTVVPVRGSLADTTVSFRCNVTNNGPMNGATSVLAYVVYGSGDPNLPLKQLFGFQRVALDVGASQTVYFAPTLEQFAQRDQDNKQTYLPDGSYTVVIGEAMHTFRVERSPRARGARAVPIHAHQ